jgi:tRNA A37 threonylcarbamoyladenosine dehydratase
MAREQAEPQFTPPLLALIRTGNFSTMAEQRILIAGAEALGSVCGGMLARNGEQVTQRGWRAHMRAIERRGGAEGK